MSITNNEITQNSKSEPKKFSILCTFTPTHKVGRVLSVSPVVGIGEPNFTVQGAKFFNFFPHLHSYKPDFRIHIIRIRILPSKSKNTKINLDFYSFVTSYSLKKLGKKPNFLLAFWKPLNKEPGSRTENTTRILTFLTHLFFIFVNYINSCTPAIIAMKKIQAKRYLFTQQQKSLLHADFP